MLEENGTKRRNLIALVSDRQKTAFLSAAIMGLLVHLYKFANTLPNHDALFNYFNHQNIVSSGRWFLMIACAPSSFYDLPWLTGIISLVYIGLTAAFVADVFSLRHKSAIVLMSGALAAFPAVTETLFFEYTADGYFMAMLLAAFAVWLTRIDTQKWLFYILGAISLCLSCGAYQAYISFGLMLSFGHLLMDAVNEQRETKVYLRWIARQLIMYAAALLAYFLIWKVSMRFWHVTANDYQGISNVGTLQLKTIMAAFGSSMKAFFSFFAGELLHGARPSIYEALGAVFLLLFAVVLVWTIVSRRLWRKKGNLALILIGVLLVPFASHIWFFTSETVEYGPRMQQSLCVLYIIVLALLDEENLSLKKYAAAGLIAVMVFHFAVQANICYFFMERCKEVTRVTAAEMLMRTHQEQNDQTEYLVVVGSNQSLKNGTLKAREIRNLTDTMSQSLVTSYKLIYLYLSNDMGLTLKEIWEDDQIEAIESMEEVQEMPIWPAQGSVKAIDNMVVIKLSEQEG